MPHGRNGRTAATGGIDGPDTVCLRGRESERNPRRAHPQQRLSAAPGEEIAMIRIGELRLLTLRIGQVRQLDA